MKFKDEAGWQRWVAVNSNDPYSSACVRYAERWVDLMEKRIAAGESLADFAKTTSHEADTEEITVSMHGAAVHVLVRCWEHGEELRRWHNLDTQLRDEGERTNETGGVLNPAVAGVRGNKEE